MKRQRELWTGSNDVTSIKDQERNALKEERTNPHRCFLKTTTFYVPGKNLLGKELCLTKTAIRILIFSKRWNPGYTRRKKFAMNNSSEKLTKSGNLDKRRGNRNLKTGKIANTLFKVQCR